MSVVPFRGFVEFGSYLLEDQLTTNLIHMFNWGLLEKGAFFNNNLSSVAPFGGNPATLRLVSDPNYTDGQVWEGARKDWVWESGITYATKPINISGVYVNNTFHPATGVGAYSHYVDYLNGRVIFNTAISTTSTVKCEHSSRWVQFEDARVPWFQTVQYGSFRIDHGHFQQVGSGMWDGLSQNRVQLPAVFIECAGQRSSRGMMLGGGKYVDQQIIFHLFGEFPPDVGKLRDLLTYQDEQRYSLFNLNLINSRNAFPLDYRNSRVNGATMYPTFVLPTGDGGYFWKTFRVKNSTVGKGLVDGRLTTGQVTWVVEIECPEL